MKSNIIAGGGNGSGDWIANRLRGVNSRWMAETVGTTYEIFQLSTCCVMGFHCISIISFFAMLSPRLSVSERLRHRELSHHIVRHILLKRCAVS
jgi:hypothetical protein